MTPDVSVVICTYNRHEMLRDTLESWKRVIQQHVAAELIVIDNASTDSTASVVDDFRAQYTGQLTYVFEQKAGLSFARNRGIDEASANIVAFVDDDIYFEPDWLTEIVAPFKARDDVDCVGGKSIPTYELATPDWLTQPMLSFYGATLSGDTDRPMEYPEHPYGVNMAFRAEVFHRIGKFNADLGRVGKSLLSNEEKDIFFRIHQEGMNVFYACRAVLQHRIPAERLTKNWILERAYWQGISNVIFEQCVQRMPRRSLCSNAALGIRRLLGGRGKGRRNGIYSLLPGSEVEDRMRTYRLLGTIRQNLAEIFHAG